MPVNENAGSPCIFNSDQPFSHAQSGRQQAAEHTILVSTGVTVTESETGIPAIQEPTVPFLPQAAGK